MHKPTNYHPPQMVMQLKWLLKQLQDEMMFFEHPPVNCSHEDLNETVRLLTKECRQHASEIGAYIQCLEGKAELASLHFKTNPGHDNQYNVSGDELLQRLKEAEQKLFAAYRVALNEPLFTHDVRAVLRKQLNSLTYLFMKTKIFDAAH